MINWKRNLLSTGLVLLAAVSAHSMQRATEIYTPIGESPGLSGTATIIGEIVSVDETTRSITVASDSERWTARVTEDTDIWIDRSKAKKTNEYGGFSDLTEGATVEVLYVDRKEHGTGPAEWIKVARPE